MNIFEAFVSVMAGLENESMKWCHYPGFSVYWNVGFG